MGTPPLRGGFSPAISIPTGSWDAFVQRFQWWDRYRHSYSLLTSRFVLDELGQAPEPKRTNALGLLHDLRLLDAPVELEAIITAYSRNRLVPADAIADAAHLALASYHKIDYLLTWNCKHLANANKTLHISKVNRRLGLATPIITTPLTLLPEETR